MNVTTCPECGGPTKLQHTRNIWNQEVRHIRTCNECPTEYVVSYGDPVIEDVSQI
jgi:hypothetical protein